MRRRSFLASAVTAVTAPSALGAAPAAASRLDTTELAPSGTVEAAGVSEVVPAADGVHVFGAAHDAFVVADCSDPTTPSVVAETAVTVDDQSLTGIQDVSASGDRALVAGPAGFVGDDQAAGAVLFDVSEPANPEQVAALPTTHAIHNAFLDGQTAYLTGSRLPEEPLLVYDVSDDTPEQVGEWSVVDEIPDWGGVNGSMYQCHDVYVREDRAYVAYWDAGTWILDVSDPTTPTPVASIGGVAPSDARGGGIAEIAQLPGNSHYVRPTPDGTVLAIGREAWNRDRSDDRYGGPGGIDLYDVREETDPSFLTALRPPVVQTSGGENHVNTAHNFGFRGRRLYTSWYTGGVRVYDLSTPTDPQTLGWWAAPGDASVWTARPLASGFVAASISDPSADREANRNYANATIYTFPDPDGDAPEPAATFAVDETGVPEQAPNYDLPTTTAATTTTTATTTPTTTATTTDGNTQTTAGESTTGDADGSSGGGVPGFGVGAAVAGATLAALHRLRRDD
jgi:hypothetical protein